MSGIKAKVGAAVLAGAAAATMSATLAPAANAGPAGYVPTFRLIAERNVQAGGGVLNLSVYRGLGNGQFVTRVIPRFLNFSRDSFQLNDFNVSRVSSNTIYDIYRVSVDSVSFQDDFAGARCFEANVGVSVNKISGRIRTSVSSDEEGVPCTF